MRTHQRQKTEEWNNSQGTSAASTTSEESFKEEEFERYQRRLSKETEKRKEKEKCEQVVKELHQLKITISRQGKQLHGLRSIVDMRDQRATQWRVDQLSRELTLTRQIDQTQRELPDPLLKKGVTRPGLLHLQYCFGCGKPGHFIRDCREQER
jgi:hypothetical protein